MLRDSKALYVANFGCSKTFFCCLREMLYEEKNVIIRMSWSCYFLGILDCALLLPRSNSVILVEWEMGLVGHFY